MSVSFTEAAKRPPIMEPVHAAVLLLMSILFPGIAAMVFGCLQDMEVMYIVVGAIQLLTVPLFGLGYIWAVVWAVFGLLVALQNEEKVGNDIENPHVAPPPPVQTGVPDALKVQEQKV